MNVNYKSDFSFVIDLYDADGNPVGFPPFDFRVTLATSTRSAWQYAASSVSGLRTSCAESAGRLLIVCDSHQLAPGRLTAQFHAYADDQAFPDGQRLTVTPFDTGISLVTGPGEEHVVPCVRLRIPVRVQMPAPLLIAYDLAAKAGFQGTPEEYAAALARLPELMEQVRLLREEADEARQLAQLALDTANESLSATELLRQQLDGTSGGGSQMIGTDHIEDGAVTLAKIDPGAVATTEDVKSI